MTNASRQGSDVGKCRPGASRKVPPPTFCGVTRGVSQGGFSEGARQRRNQLLISGGGNFHEIAFDDVIVLIQPWCKFSQTATYNNNVFLPADTKSIACKHTQSAQRWFIKNSVGGWIASVKRNFWLHAICACTEQHYTYKIRWENWWLGHRAWC